MAVPSNFRRTVSLTPQSEGDERRSDMRGLISDNTGNLPEGVSFEDMDREFIHFMDSDLKTDINGKEVPVIILSIQRYSEFSKTWKFTDDRHKNLQMPFITVVRQPNPKEGTNYAGMYNIPGRQIYTYHKVPTVTDGRKGFDIYKVPQPTSVDITYEIRFFTNSMEDLNVFGEKVRKMFRSRQHYIYPKGYAMPVIIEGDGDESNIENFEDRRFYVILFDMVLQGFILDKKDFEVIPAIDRIVSVNEILDSNHNITERLRPPKKYPIVQTQGNVIVTDSLNTVISVVECGNRYPVSSSNVTNSGSTFSINIPATSGYTLPNITHIDSNGNEVQTPAMIPFTATTQALYQNLSDVVGNINYIGSSLNNSSTSDNSWVITRITINTDGTVFSNSAFGSWDNRYLLTYT